MTKPKGIYLLSERGYNLIYGPEERRDIEALVEMVAPHQTPVTVKENPEVLSDVELIFSGWGMARVDEAFLEAAPKLQAIFYGAGSVRYFVTDALWERGIRLTSGYGANAEFVAPFTLAHIIHSLKRTWHFSRATRAAHTWQKTDPAPGLYRAKVGLVSLGMVGRAVVRYLQVLKGLEVEVYAYDPFVDQATAEALGVTLVGLEELFRTCHVVSLHTPWLPETVGMITGAHLASMQPNATFINTARGAVVREPEMIHVLQQRPDLYAVLDVTYPEPPPPDSPLYTLPNVVLTPHIAGAIHTECHYLGRTMVNELRRYLAGEPLAYEITRERLAVLA